MPHLVFCGKFDLSTNYDVRILQWLQLYYTIAHYQLPSDDFLTNFKLSIFFILYRLQGNCTK